ncbi:MAG: AAA family ATPase [Lachnospiraceae bacterium]|jgi:cytidylate kinase
MQNFVIAIARPFGSKGKEIGVALGEAFGIPCYDNQILDMASQKSGINEAAFYETNEKLRYSAIHRFLVPTPHDYVADPHTKKFTSDDNLYHIEAQIIRDLAANESCVIMGKAADVVLADRSAVVSVFITAPEEFCVNEISRRMKVDEITAAKMVAKTNRYRRQYYEYYSHGQKWDDPRNYDLCVNTAKTGKDAAVRLIHDYTVAKISALP